MQSSAIWVLPQLKSARVALKRPLSTSTNARGRCYPRDFTLLPDFLTLSEQKTLLATSLGILDSAESRQHRRWRRKLEASRTPDNSSLIQSMFLPDEFYQFEEVRVVICAFDYYHFLAAPWRRELTPVITRDTTTVLFIISAKCMLLPGRKPRHQVYHRY